MSSPELGEGRGLQLTRPLLSHTARSTTHEVVEGITAMWAPPSISCRRATIAI